MKYLIRSMGFIFLTPGREARKGQPSLLG
jgi:hypothetical protein